MKKTIYALALSACLSITGGGIAFGQEAEDFSGFIQLSVGQTSYKESVSGNNVTVDAEAKETAFKITGGTEFDSGMQLGISYGQLGDIEADGKRNDVSVYRAKASVDVLEFFCRV